MPNWVSNELTIKGSAAELDVFKHEMSEPYTTKYFDIVSDGEGGWKKEQRENVHESDLSFWNAIAPTDLDAYYGEHVSPKGERNADEIWQDIAEGFRTGMDWYNWNVRNWGTKWDACNVNCVDTTNKYDGSQLHYTFDTAWSIPENAMIAMSMKYPNLRFYLYSIEEQGWGAEMGFENGQVHVIKEWDVPESHQENMDIWDYCWKCEDIGFENDELYDDCPRRDLTENEENGSLVA